MFNRGERENEISFPTRIDSFRLFLKDLAIVSLCKSSRLGRKGKKKRETVRLQIRFNAINQASFFFISNIRMNIYYG